jgi:hypothetical protein
MKFRFYVNRRKRSFPLALQTGSKRRKAGAVPTAQSRPPAFCFLL